MNRLQILGVVLFFASFLLFYLFRYRRVAAISRSGDPVEERHLDPLSRRLREHSQRTHDLFRLGGNVFAALLLIVAVLLLWIAPDQTKHTGDLATRVPVDVARPTKAPPSPLAVGQPPCAGPCAPAEAVGTRWATSGVILTVVVLFAGVALLLAGNKWARGVGTLVVLSGLFHGYLFKEVKIDDLVKFEFKLDKLGFEYKKEIKNEISVEVAKQLTAFGPHRFDPMIGFEVGKAALLPAMEATLDLICGRWRDQGKRERPGMLLIVGSADRLRLVGGLVGQYESNVGLARARAEQVKLRLEKCGVPGESMVTVVAGPRNTPERRQPRDVHGFPEDRSVVVWALWNTLPEKAKGA
jgi:hypothetical protein